MRSSTQTFSASNAVRSFGCALAVILLAASALALDTSKLQPRGYVNDFAGVLDAAGAQAIENYCGDLERATGAQIAVVTVKSLDGEPIEDVANRLYRQWGIGKKGADEGLLLLLAVQDRKDRAEVGFGLEPVITDGYSGSVLRGISPILRQGNYAGALLAAVEQFGQRIAQSKGVTLSNSPQRTRAPDDGGSGGTSIPFPLILGGLALLFLIARMLGGGGWGGGGGGLGSFLTGMFLGNLMGRGRGYGGYGAGWSGGGFGGYSGGGGGGGGFGGFGGGDSGGGGASGSW